MVRGEVRESVAMSDVIEAYEAWLSGIKRRDEASDLFERALSMLPPPANLNAETVFYFLRRLREFEEMRFFSLSGIFLSAILSVIREETVVLDLRSLTLDFVGFRNRKSVFVEGNVGSYAGAEMEEGLLKIKWNAFGSLGREMRGGEIVVHGDAGYWVGEKMRGGRIVVEGSVKDALGVEMLAGEIIVRGSAGNYVGKGMLGGKIVVFGNVGHWLGQGMSGGEILVCGNAENGVGNWMRGGRISVEGEVGELLGLNMLAGSIRVKNMVITCANQQF